MRETEWLKSNDPVLMMQKIRRSPYFDERKFRLFGAAYCRRNWELLDDPSRLAIEVLEWFVDGAETTERMAEVARQAILVAEGFGRIGDPRARGFARANRAVGYAVSGLGGGEIFSTDYSESGEYATARAEMAYLYSMDAAPYRGMLNGADSYQLESLALADILREIVGNPFRPIRFDGSWLTPDVLTLASGISGASGFDGLPILGDALEEAGCDRTEILEHCRRPGGHVRGCWVLDSVLGRLQVAETRADPPGFWRTVRRLVSFGSQ